MAPSSKMIIRVICSVLKIVSGNTELYMKFLWCFKKISRETDCHWMLCFGMGFIKARRALNNVYL